MTPSDNLITTTDLIPDDRVTPYAPDAETPPKRLDEGDDAVARYFGEVRNFSLLDREQEQALWRRIVRLKARGRRILLTSPTALSTLTRVWNQLKHGELAGAQIMAAEAADDDQQQLEAFGAAVAAWPSFHASQSAESRWRRYRAWHPSWLALQCKDGLYDILQDDFQQAHERHPDDSRLVAAWRAWSLAQQHLAKAKADMLQANLRLVIYVARSYRHAELPLLDLVQEGNIGLMRAIEKFEPERGFKFVTYAYWWIRQAIGRGIIQQGRTVRLPSYLIERRNKLLATARQLNQRPGAPTDIEALGSALGWPPKEIEDLLAVTQSALSLQQMDREDGREPIDLLAASPDQAPEDTVSRVELQRCLASCMDALTPREVFILRQRYGFDEEPQSLREIGETLGLSRERVRQIERAALERLRQYAIRDALAEFVS